MAKLQVLPEPQLSLQVMEQITKAGEPVILPVRITQNGTYYAGADKASGYNPVTVDVDMTPAKEEGYLNGYEIGAKEGAEVGYAKGETDGYAKGHTAGVADGIEQGKQEEYNRFWDAFQQNGTRTDYENAFRVGWDDTNFKPKYDIAPVGNCSQTFQNSGVTDVKGICEAQGVTFDFSKVTYSSNPFHNSKITRLPLIDISNIPNCAAIFNYVKELVWVDSVVLNENGTQTFGTGVGYNWTLYSAKLTHLPISGTIGTNCYFNSCNLLDDETIQSIIDALKDLTGATAQTLTFHKDVGAKLTQAQKDAISAKNWTLVY